MQGLVLFLLRVGVLFVLWVFVLLAIWAIRADLRATRPTVPAAVLPPAPQANKSSRRDRRAARRGEAVRLVVTEGALAGTIVPMHDGPITIGRAQDSTLVLTDEYVSARHARFLPQGDNWVLEDMGSTNGTYLNRQRLTRPTRVPLSVPIRIGKTVLELRR